MAEISYRRHRFPPVIIQHAVWLYLRFTLSYRDVEELLAERGLDISYETVRCWVLKFGPVIARRLRRCRPRPSNRWHLDGMVVRIAGEPMYLWRAVDHEGEVLDMLVQRRRDTRAALRLMRKLLKKQGFAPQVAGHRQAALLRLRVPASATDLPARAEAAEEQSSRKLAPGGATARAQNAAVQVGSLRPAISEHARRHPQHLQPPTPSRLPLDATDIPRRGGKPMARCRRGRVSAHPASDTFCSPQVKLTVPFSEIRELHVLIKVHCGKAPPYSKSATPQSHAGCFVHDCEGEKLWDRGRGRLYNW